MSSLAQISQGEPVETSRNSLCGPKREGDWFAPHITSSDPGLPMMLTALGIIGSVAITGVKLKREPPIQLCANDIANSPPRVLDSGLSDSVDRDAP